MSNESSKINLLNFDRKLMEDFFIGLGEPKFRATQMMKWIHHFGLRQFDGMSNLSKKLRTYLNENVEIQTPEIVSELSSKDGTRKWLLKLSCGNCIETVYIPEDSRGTLCISSQVGCALNCSFCSTGKQGFNRNLTAAEIIGQLWVVVRSLSKENGEHDRQVTNIVLMGMGEPLLNFENVMIATRIMMDDFGYGLSKRRVTLSTSGLVPAMKELKQISEVSLAVSLHAPNDELRDILVPINKKYPIKELMEVCRNYYEDDSRKVMFEYVMIDGVNDSRDHAIQLRNLLRDVAATVNLIPFNPFPGSTYRRSTDKAIDQFREILIDAGLMTITRKTRGDDIAAACGQLVGQVQDRTRRKLQNAQMPD